jgi:hypothetical protein
MELAEAKAFARKIARQHQLADNAADQMALADRRDDDPAYESARGKRDTALGALRKLLEQAQAAAKKAKAGDYALELEGQLGKTDVDIADNAAAKPDQSETEADRIADTGMTDAERARMSEIDARIAQAALTPDLQDDKDRAAEKVSLLEQVLGEVQADMEHRGGFDVITDIAGQLKTARDNVTSLTSGGGGLTNDNPDLQAQLDQERARRVAAEDDARINRQALEVFGGGGDIGTGGRNAMQAAGGTTINVSTLHPGDPATLRAIGDAAAGGFGLQSSRPSPRVRVG